MSSSDRFGGRRPRRRGLPDLRGNATLFVLSLVVLFGMTAMAIDLGTQQMARTELQVGTDAAALAGAWELDKTPEGVDWAPWTAEWIADANTVLGEPIDLGPDDLVVGRWDEELHTFIPTSDPELADAVWVGTTLEDIPAPFAAVAFRTPLLSVSARAVAVRPWGPAGQLDCYLPIAVPECTYDQISGGDQSDHTFVFANDETDNVGWADPVNPTASTTRDHIRGLLDGSCADGFGQLQVDEPVMLNNGVQSSSIIMMADILSQSTFAWDTEHWGAKPAADPQSMISPEDYATTGTLQGPVAVFAHTENCEAVRFNQSNPVVAFAWGVIFDVFDGPGAHKGLQMYIDVEHEWEAPGTGGSGSGNIYTLQPPVLVE